MVRRMMPCWLVIVGHVYVIVPLILVVLFLTIPTPSASVNLTPQIPTAYDIKKIIPTLVAVVVGRARTADGGLLWSRRASCPAIDVG
jgi:hypothetical protein